MDVNFLFCPVAETYSDRILGLNESQRDCASYQEREIKSADSPVHQVSSVDLSDLKLSDSSANSSSQATSSGDSASSTRASLHQESCYFSKPSQDLCCDFSIYDGKYT